MPLNQPSYRVVEGGQHNLYAAEHLQPPKAAQTNLINIGALLIRIWFWGSIGIIFRPLYHPPSKLSHSALCTIRSFGFRTCQSSDPGAQAVNHAVNLPC